MYSKIMYAITGITGWVGGAVARNLLSKNQSVRAVVRDANKGTAWADRGYTVAVAEMNDADALTAAFANTEGVFVMIPRNFAPSTGFGEAPDRLLPLTADILLRHPVTCSLNLMGTVFSQLI